MTDPDLRRSGVQLLLRRSALAKDLRGASAQSRFAVLTDESGELRYTYALLHVLFGYNAHIIDADSVGRAIDASLGTPLDLIILWNALPPSSCSVDTLRVLRGAVAGTPILAVTQRRGLLEARKHRAAGANLTISRDALDSVTLGEAAASLMQTALVAAE